MYRLWVIEVRYDNGKWDICDFAKTKYCDTDYQKAQQLKKRICKKVSTVFKDEIFNESDFRISEYVRKEQP